ncbi:MAG: hypothetical protein JSV24_08420 [Bacteroidales bacterium]|nr:MAG: hypothetical protein JSV24_08420 [Bacteroidales bacterium]
MIKRKDFSFSGLAVIFVFIFFSGCQDKIYEEYTLNVPVYMTYDELRSAVRSDLPKDLANPGKIYFKDDYIFINENLKGVHVIDNSDPSNPLKIAFINIPGNVDLAIRGSILFADSYIDLVAIDISDPWNASEVARIENVYNYTIPPWDDSYIADEVDETIGVVVSWEVRTIREEVKATNNYPIYPWGLFNETAGYYRTTFSGSSGASYGVGGSLARFILYEDILYALRENRLKMFDVSLPEEMDFSGAVDIGWDLETLFLNENNLFIGTQTGMFIYDLSDPCFPEKISYYDHIRSCDPVVVEGDLAYVTLRAGTICGGGLNRLDVVDISNLFQPTLIISYRMVEPYGLGIDGNILFICDGEDGLKIYDASNPYWIQSRLLAHYTDLNPRDVIPVDGVLLMVGLDGFYQYDYSNPANIVYLSKIPVTP